MLLSPGFPCSFLPSCSIRRVPLRLRTPRHRRQGAARALPGCYHEDIYITSSGLLGGATATHYHSELPTIRNLSVPISTGPMVGSSQFSGENPEIFYRPKRLFLSSVRDIHRLLHLQTWPGNRRRKNKQGAAAFTARGKSCKTLIFMGLLGHASNLKCLHLGLISLLLYWTKHTSSLHWLFPFYGSRRMLLVKCLRSKQLLREP